VLDLRLANREFMAPFDTLRDDDFWTVEVQRGRIAQQQPYTWLILDGGEAAGCIALVHVVRGPLQSAVVSYWVDEPRNGRGLASAALAEVIRIAFAEVGLHRLEAGTLPENVASQRVLEKNGFRRYGLAQRYLLIGGEWRDHVLFELTAD
jgi:ribosomal-protein-alanine N-acetyltransferase